MRRCVGACGDDDASSVMVVQFSYTVDSHQAARKEYSHNKMGLQLKEVRPV